MTTRIIIKNLPPYLSQQEFTTHFDKHATPTETKLQTSKSGKSRRFGFVGYTSPSEAEAAVAYWNNTYVGSTNIKAVTPR